MSIGYACKIAGEPIGRIRTVRLNRAQESSLRHVIADNLAALEEIILYNALHHIRLFRISSDIIPLASHPSFPFDWREAFRQPLSRIGNLIRSHGIRVSMHPGQYTVLNAESPAVLSQSVSDLTYHHDFLQALEMDDTHKILLHIGGVYRDKPRSIARFIDHLGRLEYSILRKLVIENDEKNYTAEDALDISSHTGLPVVLDVFHHWCNPGRDLALPDLLDRCGKTWSQKDGLQEIHYSQQGGGKRGSHSVTIQIRPFLAFYRELAGRNLDIMLEVKDKNLSALKCIHCTDPGIHRSVLEAQWAKYQYLVMSRSTRHYTEVSGLFASGLETGELAREFYRAVEDALAQPEDPAGQTPVLLHIWEQLKNRPSDLEGETFRARVKSYRNGTGSLAAAKNHLYRMALRYGEVHLSQSYYFFHNGGFHSA